MGRSEASDQVSYAYPRVRRNTAKANKLAKSSLDRQFRSAGYFRALEMAFARTILALVTALSVAVLPAAGDAVVNAKSYDTQAYAQSAIKKISVCLSAHSRTLIRAL